MMRRSMFVKDSALILTPTVLTIRTVSMVNCCIIIICTKMKRDDVDSTDKRRDITLYFVEQLDNSRKQSVRT